MKRQELILILIPTFICVIAWIGFNIYDSYVTSTITPQEESQIIPINPSFNTKVISDLKLRERFEPTFTGPSITPSPVLIPTKILNTNISTKSAVATSGGKLSK